MSSRGAFSSKIGFILAGAGSAIGLGAIWRFPYMTGANGGAIFVLVFLACCFLIGVPVMIAEITLGRRTERNPVGTFRLLHGGARWKAVGVLGVLSGFMIFSWYSVIAGWVAGYLWEAARGTFSTSQSPEQVGEFFARYVSHAPTVLFLHFLIIATTAAIVLRGIKEGIEALSKWLMPVLFVLLVLLAIRSVTLPGAGAGLAFYLKPDFSELNGRVLLAAMGQALFSLSIGMGTMLTYGSYLSKKEDIPAAAAWVTLFEILISIVAGFVILPAVSAMGQNYAEGPRLIFVVLPSIFAAMPGGYLFGVGFYLLVIIAVLTSTVSILEVPVAYFVDERGWSRQAATLFVSGVAFVLGIPAGLAFGANTFLTHLPAIGTDYFTVVSTLFGDISLSVGCFFIALFLGWVWGVPQALAEIRAGGQRFRLAPVWAFLIRYVAPISILAVFANVLIGLFWG
ncbi:MAG TPA: sodium-dependent transporter [Vicinamibacterales bacterium]|nr:sodium-dependent transporter [Vicinamibacterales bacterium]